VKRQPAWPIYTVLADKIDFFVASGDPLACYLKSAHCCYGDPFRIGLPFMKQLWRIFLWSDIDEEMTGVAKPNRIPGGLALLRCQFRDVSRTPWTDGDSMDCDPDVEHHLWIRMRSARGTATTRI
jgi:hypothetical protein